MKVFFLQCTNGDIPGYAFKTDAEAAMFNRARHKGVAWVYELEMVEDVPALLKQTALASLSREDKKLLGLEVID